MQDTDVKGRVMAAAELMFVSVLTFLENAIKKKKNHFTEVEKVK